MKGTRTSLWLFLLLNQLLCCATDADHRLSTMQPPSLGTREDAGSSHPELRLTTTGHTNFPDTNTNGTQGNCLINTEMGLIAVGSAGGLIVCLLVATVVLACQVRRLQRRVCGPRTSQSNMDLVSGTGFWGTDEPEVRGLFGPCDESGILEEVRSDSKVEEETQVERREAREEAGGGLVQRAGALNPEEKIGQMQGSSSRNSCLEVPRDLEDMPLVV